MTQDFQTEDMKQVFSSILLRFQEETDDFLPSAPPPIAKISSTTSSINTATSISATDPSPKKEKRKIKATDFSSTTLARMNLKSQQSKDRFNKRKEFENEKIMQTLKQKPEINPLSQKIGKRNLKVYERVEKDLEVSKKKFEEKKKKILAEKEEKITKELTFKPDIGEYEVQKRTIEDFFEYNLEWKKRRSKRLEMKKAEIEEQESVELKFVPAIDENSASLVQQMGISKPIEIRLLERAQFANKKLEEKRKENAYTFAPDINVKSRRLGRRKVTENDVFKRLCSLSVDSKRDDKSPRFGGTREHKSFSFPDEYSFER